MSSAASRPPFSTEQSLASAAQSTDSTGARPPKRPQLMGPPARPKPPKPAPEPEPAVAQKAAAQKPPEPETPKVIGPISTPSERMQYRAIGLLKGKYVASEEQFNRGDILLSDDTLIDSVLLGRVTSLIKKHIDLETEHLWVVYPRTLYKEEDNEPALHMQIVGVWEPETLSAAKESTSKETAEDSADKDNADKDNAEEDSDAPRYLSTVEATEQCDQFSIRGEIAKYSEEDSEITVNIVQKSKSENVKPKRPFKLLISGTLEGRTTGYFWDLKVRREGGQLILEKAAQIAVVPPKKKSKDARSNGGRKRPTGGKPRTGSSAPKPMPKKKQADGEGAKVADAEVKSTEVKLKSADAKVTPAKVSNDEVTETTSDTAASSAQVEETVATSTESPPAETPTQAAAPAETQNESQAVAPQTEASAEAVAEESSTETPS